MPFFSFSINDNIVLLNDFNLKQNQVYFSKSTNIWKTLNKEKNKNSIVVNREKRQKVIKMGNRVLFCLPPNIGLGDAIEYARALKSLKDKNIFKYFGIAFSENYSFVFKSYFKLDIVYPYTVPKDIINKYDSLFHFTLEIDALKKQKYIRSNIEEEIKNYFKIVDQTNFLINKKNKIKIKKISIFPISNSPIRTMPSFVLNQIINFLKKYFLLEVYLDESSEISNYLLKHIKENNIMIVNCKNKVDLVNSIKDIEYGIFMDSGPLHVAKLFNKRGALIESSVSSKILLSNYNNIISISNSFSSTYCKSPCGLTDLFSYKSKSGCYNALKIKKSDIIRNNLFSLMGRRGVKNNYTSYIKNPVGCLQSLNVQNILTYIKKDLSL